MHKLQIKDHKKKDDNGEFIRRLVILATNFTAAFPKLDNIGIWRILDKAGVK